MKIKANDIVYHKTLKELWSVWGVDYEKGELIPNGFPFPIIAKIKDCEFIEHGSIPQMEQQKQALMDCGCESFVEHEEIILHKITADDEKIKLARKYLENTMIPLKPIIKGE